MVFPFDLYTTLLNSNTTPGSAFWALQCTHAQQQALVLLNCTQTTQETRHHDDGAEGDDEVGGGERGERGRQGGEAALRNRQPHADTQQSTAAQLKRTQETQTSC